MALQRTRAVEHVLTVWFWSRLSRLLMANSLSHIRHFSGNGPLGFFSIVECAVGCEIRGRLIGILAFLGKKAKTLFKAKFGCYGVFRGVRSLLDGAKTSIEFFFVFQKVLLHTK